MIYLGEVAKSALSVIFVVFAISAIGYLLGRISIKGISLGTAGVLLSALLFGIAVSYIPAEGFKIGESVINLYSEGNFKLVSNIGTALFVTAVGLIAGPKFFRTFNRKSMSYISMGVILILVSGVCAFVLMKITGTSSAMMTGLLTGALTTTPGFSAATDGIESTLSGEAAQTALGEVSAGYGIAYIFGVLGVVLFVQILPRLLKIDIAKERENFVAANTVKIPEAKGKRIQIEEFGFFPFFLTIALGVLIGAIKIPGLNFSLGTSGGTLVAGLIVGHFGHFGPIDMVVPKQVLNFVRELGLVLFLVGAGVPGGIKFIAAVKAAPLSLLYGFILMLVPLIVGYLLARYVFKLSIFNNLGAITGGMTSTPALGALIATAGTDDVASAYAATYPTALVTVVIVCKVLVML